MESRVLSEFDAVMEELLQVLGSMSEEELNERPKDKSWSAAQVGDHLRKSFQIADILKGKVESTSRDPEEKLKGVEESFLDFSIKMEAPAELHPKEGGIDKEHLLKSLEERIELQREVIKSEDLSKTCLDFAIPEYGNFTRLEWIRFNMVHTRRHIQQLKNLTSALKK